MQVIEPSRARFHELLEWNRVNGTAEGGDQCLLNEVRRLLPRAHTVRPARELTPCGQPRDDRLSRLRDQVI